MTDDQPTATAALAEQLWISAHDRVKRAEFAAAADELGRCFQILQALGDPRLPEVHKRWTEVHALAVEDANRGVRAVAAAEDTKAPTPEAEAEAAANRGDLDEAVRLYAAIAQQNPQSELVAERLQELQAAQERARELTGRGTASWAPAAAAEAPVPAAAAPPLPEDEDVDLEDSLPPLVVGVAASQPPTAPVDDAEESGAYPAIEASADIHEAQTVIPAAVQPSRPPEVAPSAAFAPEPAPEPMSSPEPAIAVEAAAPAAIPVEAAPVPAPVPPEFTAEAPPPPPSAAPPMAEGDAPVGMASLEVSIDMGADVSADDADDLPIELDMDDVSELTSMDDAAEDDPADANVSNAPGAATATATATATPAAAAPAASAAGDDVAAQVAFLEELLVRVKEQRRPRAA